MIKIYGIKNCDKVRDALKFLREHHREFEFIDYRQNPISEEKLAFWQQEIGDELINKRSTTYKNLADKTLSTAVILENITLLKRPIIETPTATYIGTKTVLESLV